MSFPIRGPKVGDSAEISKKFTEQDLITFASLSLDYNPIHLDASYAENTIFKRPIVHGFLVGSLISSVIGTKLPGRGSIYLQQELKFKKPVYVGDEILARVEILEHRTEKSIFVLKTDCLKGNEVVIEGTAVVKVLSPQDA